MPNDDDGGNGNGNGDGGTPPPATGDDGERTFTQAELDAAIKKRLERERTRFADYEALKEAAEELSKLKDADLSDQEKLKNRIAELEQGQAEADDQAKKREVEISQRLLRAEVRVVAAGLDFIDPETAWKLADLAGVETDADGVITGVKEALDALVGAKPHLIKAPVVPGSPPNDPKGKGRADKDLAAVRSAAEKYGIRVPKEPGD